MPNSSYQVVVQNVSVPSGDGPTTYRVAAPTGKVHKAPNATGWDVTLHVICAVVV